MARIIWTTPALEDAEEIRDYIARDSPHYARLVVERIVGAVERLTDYPESGVSFRSCGSPRYAR